MAVIACCCSSRTGCCAPDEWPDTLYGTITNLDGSGVCDGTFTLHKVVDGSNFHCPFAINGSNSEQPWYGSETNLHAYFCVLSTGKFCEYVTGVDNTCEALWCIDILSCTPFHAIGTVTGHLGLCVGDFQIEITA